jgi:hypothetical protein
MQAPGVSITIQQGLEENDFNGELH